MSSNRDGLGLGRRVGGAIGGAIDAAVDGVGAAGQLLVDVLRLPGLTGETRLRAGAMPGAAAGVEHEPDAQVPPPEGLVTYQVLDYGPDRNVQKELSLEEALRDDRPEWSKVRWLRVVGVHPYVLNQIAQRFELSTLAAEDVLHAPQRPRTEAYDEYLFVVLQLASVQDAESTWQQISLFVLPGLVISFQQHPTSIWEPIEARLGQSGSRLRGGDASYLAYALLDTVVDYGFPLLERYADRLDQLEDAVMQTPTPEILQLIHGVKRELTVLRRMLWPTREMTSELRREDQILVTEETRAYLSDVEDHCVQQIDVVETLRDLAASLTDLYLSMASHRANEVMQVLTVIATIFIPITFLAGVYGMNFRYIPEMDWRYAYPTFWLTCFTVAGGLLWYFKKRGWFGD
ncbi:MAG: magnesium/cobalt transporter CorA [Myxococcales bacterium]|jgi:magnesium transporter